MRRIVTTVCGAVIVASAATLAGQAGPSGQAGTPSQPASVAARLGQPDYVYYNGKIVTMDDASFTSAPGKIVQAMSVRGSKILETGTNDYVRQLAGPNTKLVDLKGRTVLPSFILTHEHPTDWAWAEPESLKHVFQEGNPDLVVRFLTGTGDEQIAKWESVLKEAVAAAKPGQWILLSSDWGANYENMAVLWEKFLKGVTKERLDALAPNNPVRVKNSWIDGVLNTKGLEEIRKIFPDAQLEGRGNRSESGRQLEPDVILHNKLDRNAELLKSEMALWAAHGVTTFGSSPTR